jgi:hypothetical protein
MDRSSGGDAVGRYSIYSFAKKGAGVETSSFNANELTITHTLSNISASSIGTRTHTRVTTLNTTLFGTNIYACAGFGSYSAGTVTTFQISLPSTGILQPGTRLSRTTPYGAKEFITCTGLIPNQDLYEIILENPTASTLDIHGPVYTQTLDVVVPTTIKLLGRVVAAPSFITASIDNTNSTGSATCTAIATRPTDIHSATGTTVTWTVTGQRAGNYTCTAILNVSIL